MIAVGGFGKVRKEIEADASDVPPAFVAVIVILLYSVSAVRPVIVTVVPDTVELRVVVLFLTVYDVMAAVPVGAVKVILQPV